MERETLYNSILAFVQKGKTQEAFDYLRNQDLDPATSKKLALIEAEYHELADAEFKGVLREAEIQVRNNRIRENLLSLFDEKAQEEAAPPLKSTPIRYAIGIGMVLIAVIIYVATTGISSYDCPDFSGDFNNKILVLPFEKVGSEEAKPQVVLRDKINQLTAKNNLSTIAKLGTPMDNLTMNEAPALAEKCAANILIWGTYSSGADSIRLIMNYYFTQYPEWNNLGELVALKDVTELQTGRMTKNLDDVIMSLCGLIAARAGNIPLTKKWFEKVKNKEAVDERVLEVLD